MVCFSCYEQESFTPQFVRSSSETDIWMSSWSGIEISSWSNHLQGRHSRPTQCLNYFLVWFCVSFLVSFSFPHRTLELTKPILYLVRILTLTWRRKKPWGLALIQCIHPLFSWAPILSFEIMRTESGSFDKEYCYIPHFYSAIILRY